MSLTYRTKRRLQRAGLVGLILLLVGILAWFCWVIWLERYVVYTREGATINFDLEEVVGPGQLSNPPSTSETISLYINEGSNAIDLNREMTQITGFYIDSEMLQEDINSARDTIATLSSGTAVMVELKNILGGFNYSSNLMDAVYASSIDTTAVDSLITDITSRNLYAIAVVPAFRDRNFGLNHVSAGLPIVGGGGVLWVDDQKCYWLDPTDSDTLNWLRQIADELKSLGFEEVVFSEFRFPDTQRIVFKGDRTEAINKAANSLVTACAADGFAVSFMTSASDFKLPEGRTRIYLENVGAKNAGATAATYNVADPKINMVFLSNTNDTRFDDYSVLRPITLALDMKN